ncbi:MAG: cysteine desulfurase, partial [Acidimicrobiia bacterium]
NITNNATEAQTHVARTWGEANQQQGDDVEHTEMEHHANIVPWHQLVERKGIVLRWVPLTDDGQLELTDLPSLLDGAKVFAFTAMSNVLGTITPVKQLCAAAHAAGAIAIVDGCQSVPHLATDVQDMGADFLAFSSHKLCGPTGVGVLWGRETLLGAMPPFLGGGNMIADVRKDGFTTAELPAKFEAGTPPIIEAVGMHAAIEYLQGLGMANIRRHEMDIARYAIDTLTERYGDEITIHGPRNIEVRGATLSFAFRGIHPHDLSQVLDQSNVCVRAGHHCAKPLMRVLGVGATARASFYVYNDVDDADVLADALDNASDIFSF